MTLQFHGVQDAEAQKLLNGSIEVLAWSWGASRGHDANSPGFYQDLSLTKWVGPESAHCFKMVLGRTKIDSVVLRIENEPTQIITLKNVTLSSVSTGGSGGENRLTENMTFESSEAEIAFEHDVRGDKVRSDVKLKNNVIEQEQDSHHRR
jgi:type VI secretion system secreted protein Hcp